MKARTTSPEIVVREGKPVAVIIDIEEYRELLQRLEDLEDLKALDELRREPLKLRGLEDFLAEYSPDA
ncbi:MAG TPA: type II toxin-antitoxin system prevent-host-death family antitoxin [Thermoanaerobaculia bacterium]|nr:type II toxin-antitoxin system prevent-host-death family antitoxin [Thermoanaerobaculia bacterium]